MFDRTQTRWPTIQDLLVWLKSVKLRGRAGMWQALAERILLAMTYGELGAVVNTQESNHVRELLDHNVVLEMDGLSSNSDRKMFSEALTLYLYRYRLAQGPQAKLTNLIILEEAHNLLLRKAAEAKESMLETSIRMIRQYGMGYVFVDQSASLLSKVAFANSYATIALSQKLRGDTQAMAEAMNTTDEQRDALSTLPIGTAVVRLADEHPEPFLIRIPLTFLTYVPPVILGAQDIFWKECIMGSRNRNAQKLKRLESKTHDAKFLTEIQEGLNCSPFEADAVLQVGREVYLPYWGRNAANAPPGKITLVAVPADEPAGKPVEQCRKQSVCLTLHRGAEDDRLLQEHGAAAFRIARILDLCQQALMSRGVADPRGSGLPHLLRLRPHDHARPERTSRPDPRRNDPPAEHRP